MLIIVFVRSMNSSFYENNKECFLDTKGSQMIDHLDDFRMDDSFHPSYDILNALDGILDDLSIVNDLSQ